MSTGIACAFQLPLLNLSMAVFSLENGELVDVCLVIYLIHGFQEAGQLFMKPLDFLTHKTLITDSIKAVQAGFSILV